MNARGQGALEYLMSYGWVLLVIAVVGGALWGLGFLKRPATAPTASGFQILKPLLISSELGKVGPPDAIYGYSEPGKSYTEEKISTGFSCQFVNSLDVPVKILNMSVEVDGHPCENQYVSKNYKDPGAVLLDIKKGDSYRAEYLYKVCIEGLDDCKEGSDFFSYNRVILDFLGPGESSYQCTCRQTGCECSGNPCKTCEYHFDTLPPQIGIPAGSQFTDRTYGWSILATLIEGENIQKSKSYSQDPCGNMADGGHKISVDLTYLTTIGGKETVKHSFGEIHMSYENPR